MAIKGVHHVNLAVEDIELMSDFYRDALGFTEMAVMEWGPDDVACIITGVKRSAAKVAMLKCENLVVELIQYVKPETRIGDQSEPFIRGYTHICLEVTDIDAEFERLGSHGMTFHAPPPPREDREFRAIYGRDPEGNIIELQELFGEGNALELDTFRRLAGR
jgi:catechol 2,3-dioxygenase-like lactoylglutathione lyase family enzyme